MTSLPFSPLDFRERLACNTCALLGLQLFMGEDPQQFCDTYDRHATTGYHQLPLLPRERAPATGPVAWVVARRGAEVLGTMACIQVPADLQGRPLADEMAAGLLYPASTARIERRGWIVGAGPALTRWGTSAYLAGGWLAPEVRGLGLVGALSRLVVLQLLEREPALQTVWGLEEETILHKGSMQRAGGIALTHSEKVFEGFFVITGAPKTMHAVWEPRESYLAQLSSDFEALSGDSVPSWLLAAKR